MRIAVLDTWPEVRNQQKLRDKLAAKGTALKEKLTAAGMEPSVISRVMNRFDRAAGDGLVPADQIYTDYLQSRAPSDEPRCVSYHCDGSVQDPQKIPDHGLFVADLIKEVAPGAEISVYRVLNDWGVSDLRAIVRAVTDAIDKAGGDPLIINLSLGIAPPLAMVRPLLANAEFAFRNSLTWTQETHRKLQAASRLQTAQSEWGPNDGKDPSIGTTAFSAGWGESLLARSANGRVRLDGPLKVLDLLFGAEHLPPNVLIVAAAGNDSCVGWVADPRIPAAIEGVLGVSAAVPVKGRPGYWRTAVYSNADDLTAPTDGIAAFGGDVDDLTGGSINAPIGLYVSDDVPGGNMTGLVQWSGTSAATPIAAAYAACIWAAEPDADAATVLEAIVKNPDGSERRAIPLGYI